ncbi:MAG: peptidyl-prolyl cis-trans isomerase [bacterium]|nr:peptidyl-prolyl cis-trans isomerase [bacterium]
MHRPLMLLIAALFVLAGCGGDEGDEGVIATVQGERITQEEAWELMGADPGTPIPDEVVGRLITRRLVLREALDLGITVPDEKVERIYEALAANDEVILAGGPAARMREQKLRDKVREDLLYEAVVGQEVLDRIKITEAEIAAYYREHVDELGGRPLRFYQIVTKDRESADAVLARLDAGEDFEELARSLSIAPEGPAGGLVEVQGSEDLPGVLATALEGLKVGEIGGPVETDYGFHLLLIRDEPEEKTVPPLALVRDRIHDILFDEKSASEREKWLAGLWAKAEETIWRAPRQEPEG